MSSTKEAQWIEVNNNAIKAFDGVPAIVVCDNCRQAVTANKDWIQPELNKDYAEYHIPCAAEKRRCFLW